MTVLIRDADGQPMPTTRIELYQPQPPAPPRGIAQVMTDATGHVTIERLEPGTTYVLQFQGGAWIIMDGQERGFRPIQFADDQNAGRELLAPDDVAGFPIHMGDEADVTIRFVIGGTFAAGDLVVAVPMIDLAEHDDAPVRPVNPLTGAELTPLEARTFHAVIGQPWGVVPAPSNAVSGATVSMDAGPAVPIPQPPTVGQTINRGSAALVGLLVALSTGLLALVALLFVQLRRRAQ